MAHFIMRAKMHCKARCQVCFVHRANTVETGLSLALQTRASTIQSNFRSQTQHYGATSQKLSRAWPNMPRQLNPMISPSQLQLPLLSRMPIRPINRRSMTSRSTTPLVVMVSECQTPPAWATKPTAMSKIRSPSAIQCSRHIRRSLYLRHHRPIRTRLPYPLHTSLIKVTVI